MKTPDTANAMPSAMDSADFLVREKIEQVMRALAFIFTRLTPRELSSLSETYDPRFADDIDTQSYMVGRVLAEVTGFPHGADHQQPYDMVRMFPFSLSRDMYETQGEFSVSVFLFYVWCYDLKSAAGKCREIDALMEHAEETAEKLVISYGHSNPTLRRIDLECALERINWFRFTHGCFDMDSGVLTDPDSAAMREYEFGGGRYEH